MALYYCEECAVSHIDNDLFPGAEHPNGLVCPECVNAMDEEIAGEDYRKPRVAFSRDQITFIKQQEALEGVE